MTTRLEQKNKTRRAILDAALKQLSDERSFTSLSLREVAREAGIAPTSFYRHFDNMNDLGLALVEEAGLSLRQLLRRARERITEQGTAIDTSVDTFAEYVQNYPNHFRLLLKEKTGSVAEFRAAIHVELLHFTAELKDYIDQRAFEHSRPNVDALLIADAMITLVFAMGTKFLEANKILRLSLIKDTKLQLKMLMAGAMNLVN